MIGYYIHHQGSGHLHRAIAVSAELGLPVTGLSSRERPEAWREGWVQLEPDDAAVAPEDVTASGRLHWVPQLDAGLRIRMAAVSRWIEQEQPRLIVADVSVEIALLARLHGVPVVTVVLPGDRSDQAHQLGFGISTSLVAVWPNAALGMVRGLDAHAQSRLYEVGGLSRFPVRAPAPRRPGRRRVVVLLGDGGGVSDPLRWDEAQSETPEWDWTVLGRDSGTWTNDPYPLLCDADVVVTHAGQNAIAEVAAARRPAIIVPAGRPHREQLTTAEVLADGSWPVCVRSAVPESGWRKLLDEVAEYDGETWVRWTDGHAARRFGDVLREALAATDVDRSWA